MKHCGICPKCGELVALTKHHIIPCRFKGRKKQVLYICLECHRSLEIVIPKKEKEDDMFYYKIVIKFLNGGK